MKSYSEISLEKFNKFKDRNDYIILAIESSCDETAVAITKGREILSSSVFSQIDIHKAYGGVVPEIASRNHVEAIDKVLDEALEKAKLTLKDIDLIAFTKGAGLLGALLVGVCYAKALAYALEIPFIGVNHIKGHIAANFINSPNLEYPFIGLIASGGHTEILKVESFKGAKVLGETVDDAVGEAFDKVARVIGLPYPGGPEIDKLAKTGKAKYKFTRPFKGQDHLNFSYSGLKTGVINLVHNAKQKGEEIYPQDLAKSFQDEAIGFLVDNTIKASKQNNIPKIVIAGGVAANSYLRQEFEKICKKENIDLYIPPVWLCTDNAAMIGVAAYEEIKEGAMPDDLSLDADPSL